MLARLSFSLLGLVFLAGCCCCCNDTSGPSTPTTAEGKAFSEANGMITSYDANNGIGYGNTEEAKQIAVAFGELAAEMEPEWFEGGDSGGISLSKGNFLTYCRMNKNSVCFLVHVPDLSEYKGDVRDSLIDMLWLCAWEVLDGKVDDDTEVAVGLRGAIFYGGLAIGQLDADDPSQTENSTSVDDDKLHRFFLDDEAADETSDAEAPAASVDSDDPEVDGEPDVDGEPVVDDEASVDGEPAVDGDPIDNVEPTTDEEPSDGVETP